MDVIKKKMRRLYSTSIWLVIIQEILREFAILQRLNTICVNKTITKIDFLQELEENAFDRRKEHAENLVRKLLIENEGVYCMTSG
jgi:hypothetical protein